MTGTAAPCDLSVIIPFYNAAATLERVAGDVLALGGEGVRCQVILVDDASTDGSGEIARRLATEHPEVLVLRHEVNAGAGVARMTGWPHATGRYALFFDADDILHGDVLCLTLARMEAHPQVDTAMLAYRYERGKANTGLEMSFEDTKVFRRLLKAGAPAIGTPAEMGALLTVTNYPWNKVIRTAHFRRAGLRFGTTHVNNDILGHWEMIVKARRVMLSDEVICTHLVDPEGENITNQFGAQRLQMLEALGELYDMLESDADLRRREAHRFWRLAQRLYCWARPRLEPGIVPRFDAAWRALIGRIDLGDYADLRLRHDPALADALANHLLDRQGS
ncbi:MAG: glycosyltransferase family 2 protein [Roseovarius sp.]|uniref:glycosyltransferase family 2 protein n=1 Tax=Roseovarius sp. TaxID=1486281 RepID=UPI0032EC242E